LKGDWSVKYLIADNLKIYVLQLLTCREYRTMRRHIRAVNLLVSICAALSLHGSKDLNRCLAPFNAALYSGELNTITQTASLAFIIFHEWWNPQRSHKFTELQLLASIRKPLQIKHTLENYEIFYTLEHELYFWMLDMIMTSVDFQSPEEAYIFLQYERHLEISC
jgi:hypothetical protein